MFRELFNLIWHGETTAEKNLKKDKVLLLARMNGVVNDYEQAKRDTLAKTSMHDEAEAYLYRWRLLKDITEHFKSAEGCSCGYHKDRKGTKKLVREYRNMNHHTVDVGGMEIFLVVQTVKEKIMEVMRKDYRGNNKKKADFFWWTKDNLYWDMGKPDKEEFERAFEELKDAFIFRTGTVMFCLSEGSRI